MVYLVLYWFPSQSTNWSSVCQFGICWLHELHPSCECISHSPQQYRVSFYLQIHCVYLCSNLCIFRVCNCVNCKVTDVNMLLCCWRHFATLALLRHCFDCIRSPIASFVKTTPGQCHVLTEGSRTKDLQTQSFLCNALAPKAFGRWVASFTMVSLGFAMASLGFTIFHYMTGFPAQKDAGLMRV